MAELLGVKANIVYAEQVFPRLFFIDKPLPYTSEKVDHCVLLLTLISNI